MHSQRPAEVSPQVTASDAKSEKKFISSTVEKDSFYLSVRKAEESARSLVALPHQSLFRTSFLRDTPADGKAEAKNEIYIRKMSKAELSLVMNWGSQIGWNSGKYQVDAFFAMDPEGYRILTVNGEPAVAVAAVRHTATQRFIGHYIANPATEKNSMTPLYRGKGYGKILWNTIMDECKTAESVGLNAVLDQVENYKKSGFVPAYFNTRWRIKASIKPAEIEQKGDNISLQQKYDFSALAQYDAKIFSVPREAFLREWLRMRDSHVVVAMEGETTVRGYGVISRTDEGYKIAPLFADTDAIAVKIYTALCGCIKPKESEFIQIDVTADNPLASDFAKHFGFEKQFDTIRMYKGAVPKIDNKRVFALTTLDIG